MKFLDINADIDLHKVGMENLDREVARQVIYGSIPYSERSKEELIQALQQSEKNQEQLHIQLYSERLKTHKTRHRYFFVGFWIALILMIAFNLTTGRL